MRTAFWVGAFVFVGLCGTACQKSLSSAPTLSVSPNGTVQVMGSQVFTATVGNTTDPVSWTLSGPGSLSSAQGYQTTYVAPTQLGSSPASATLTASVGVLTRQVTLSLTPAASAPLTIPATDGGLGLSASVKVEYDLQQIPHIFCQNALDCFMVQGYLQARDRLFEMDLLRRTSRGRLASLIGPLEVSSDEEFLTFFVTRDGQRIEDKLNAYVQANDPKTYAVLQAFSAGVNAYLGTLQQNPSLIPGEYAQLPTPITSVSDIPDWTPQDTLALARLQQFQLSESADEESAYGNFAAKYAADPGRLAAWIRCGEPVHAYTLNPGTASLVASREPVTSPAKKKSVRQSGRALAAAEAKRKAYAVALAEVHRKLHHAQELLGQLGVSAGSNNWVVDAAHSATGQAMVANDPHLSFAYPPLFHLAAMTSADGAVDITGGAFPGIPGALVGRGKHVGWGVTVVGYDVTDLYLEELNAGRTFFGGSYVPLTVVPYTINVRGASAVPYMVEVAPHHGPIIAAPSPGIAITMRWTGAEVSDDLAAFIGLNTATRVGQLGDLPDSGTAFGALTQYTTGAQNFVLADDQGNIGYDPHALVPLRPWVGQTSVATSQPMLPWLPLPGDGEAEWGSGNPADTCDTTPNANCWVPDNLLPSGTNPSNGFFVTANSDPVGSCSSVSPPGVPPDTYPSSVVMPDAGNPYLSFDWDDPTGFRATRITQMLQTQLTGGGKVSEPNMQTFQSDHTVTLAESMQPFIPPSSGDGGTPYDQGLAMMQQWKADSFDCPTGLSGPLPSSAPDTDAVHARDSAACLLFHTFMRTLITNVFADDMAAAGISVDDAKAVRSLFFMLQPGTPAPLQGLCNNVDSTGTLVTAMTCAQQVSLAFNTAVEQLTAAYGAPSNWIWGSVHTLSFGSLAAPLVGTPFAVGPYARPGGALTVDVGNPDLTSSNPRSFAYTSGSQVRHISVMDPNSPLTQMQLPGPQRDGPAGVTTPAYDLLGHYVQNQYFQYFHGTQIDSLSGVVSVETFNP
jgi:penicillin amidase